MGGNNSIFIYNIVHLKQLMVYSNYFQVHCSCSIFTLLYTSDFKVPTP